MRVNAPRGGTILQVIKTEKRCPGAFTTLPGRFLRNDFRAFAPPGRYQKNRKKGTHLPNAGRYEKHEKQPTPLTRTQQPQMAAAAGVDHVATQQHRLGTQHGQGTRHR